MSILVLISSLAWPMLAQAAPGFYSPKDVPAEFAINPKVLQKTIQASMLLWIGSDVINAPCSAQLLSSDGYVLTAAHCLRYISSKARRQLGMQKMTDDQKNYEWDLVAHPTAQPLISVTAQRSDIHQGTEGKSFYSGSARVVYVGRGIPSIYPDPMTDLSAQALQQMKQDLDDFVILKLDLHHAPCTQARTTDDPSAGDRVWDIGYPDAAPRKNGCSSSGTSAFISVGKILDSTMSILKADGYSDIQIERQRTAAENDEIYLNTDVDTHFRSSGSVLIDSRGQGVGLMSHSYDGAGDDAAEISYFVRFSHVRRMIEKDLGARIASQVFSCSRAP